MHSGTQERHGVVYSGVLGIPRAELEGLECMAEGAGLWTPRKVWDLESGLGTAPFCTHPLDEGGRTGRECGAQDSVALLAQGAGRAEGLTGSAERAGGRRVHRAALAPAGGRGAGGAARPFGGADVAPVLGGLLVLVVALPVYIRGPVPGLLLVLTLVWA